MIKVITILLLLAVVVLADEPSVSITTFTGLNTNTDIMKLKPGEFSIGLNGNINTGVWWKRKGYYKVYPTGDTTLGDAPHSSIFSFRRVDGRRRIIGVTSQAGDTVGASIDSTGIGWLMASSALPISNTPGPFYVYKEGPSFRYYRYVYTGITPHWTYWNDRCYMTNGRQRPLVFHPYDEFGKDGYARELVPLTPGEPLIVPMDVSGNLNGTYYYMIGHSAGCGSSVSANALTNGDFESWTGDKPDNWDTLSATAGLIKEEGTITKNGNSSLRIITSPNDGQRVEVRQVIEVDADSAWTLDFWVKSTGRGNFLQVTIADSANGSSLGAIRIADSTPTFIQYRKGFRPRSDRDTVIIDFAVNTLFFGTGVDTFYIDSVTVRASNLIRHAVVTKSVEANNENILLTHFPWQAIVSGCAYDDGGYNSLNIDIYRTKANPGKIDISDLFYLINSIALSDTSQIDTLIFIDTIPDDTLGSGDFIITITLDTLEIGLGPGQTVTGVRVGAPTYVSADSIKYWDGGSFFPDTTDCTGACDSISDTALYRGVSIFTTVMAVNETVEKTSYICTYYDTLIDAESDSSRSLHILKINNDNMYRIGLPPLPGGKQHLTRRLYKSYEYNIPRQKDSIFIIDTTLTVDWAGRFNLNQERAIAYVAARDKLLEFINNYTGITIEPPYDIEGQQNQKVTYRIKYAQKTYYREVDSVVVDTTVTMYRLLAEISGTDSVYIDTVGFDSLLNSKPYFKSAAPFALNYIISFQDRLWGAVGSRLYWSFLDSGAIFGSFRNLELNADDGDEITAILPKETFVKVYKNRSQFAVFPGTEFEFERTWTVDGIGCIAPHSAVSVVDGLFYLSHRGIIKESSEQFRTGASIHGIISEPINNILMNRTANALSKAYGFVHNDKYWLSFTDIDTTFVYHFKTGGWTIYDYAFLQATLYDTLLENDKSFTPSNDMLFVTGEDDELYKADTLSKDAVPFNGSGGSVIPTHYRSAPLLVSANDYKIEKSGVWRESNDATGGIDVRFYNMEGDSVWYQYMSDSIALRYDIHGVNVDESNYFQIDISDTTLDSLAIPRIDNWMLQMGEKIVK